MRRSTLPRRIAALLLVLLAGTATLSTGAVAQDDGGDVQIEVTECGDSGGDCSSGPTQVVEAAPPPAQTQTAAAPAPARAPSKPAQPAAPASEVRSYDLTTGQGTVSTDGTAAEATKIAVERTQEVERPDAREPAPSPTLPDVQTTGGGSPFAGFGSNFSFVTANEALARFAIPPFLQPIYQAAGRAYGVPWNVLAAINSIETDFGRIENQVSYAGALGWMQFMPGTWERYGVDATGDGVADPWNPVDAIYAAARYLKAAGAEHDLRRAILAYNHADWYADSVLKTASMYGSLPSGLVAETGSLAYGRFPLRGEVSYGDDYRRAQAAGSLPHGLKIAGGDGARAIATQAVTVREILLSPELADTLEHQKVLRSRGVTNTRRVRTEAEPANEPAAPTVPALDGVTLTTIGSLLGGLVEPVAVAPPVIPAVPEASAATLQSAVAGVHASSDAPATSDGGDLPSGFGRTSTRDLSVVVADALGNTYRYEGLVRLHSGLRPGMHLDGGDTIGFVGSGDRAAFVFALRAAGGSQVDPRPLVDGYRLQEAAGFQNVASSLGENPFVPSATAIAAGSVSGTDRQLAERVLHDSGISIYPCGRQDIVKGDIDRRVLGALLYLRKAGMTLTVTSLHCGHGYYTASGNVSAHSYGAAVDIAAFNGQPVLGHQGPGTLIEHAIKLLMQLKGNAAPSQLISLMTLGGPSFALADHADHLHVGYAFQPSMGLGRTGDALGNVTFKAGGSLLGSLVGGGAGPETHGSRADEAKLSKQLSRIRNPKVRSDHGRGSVKVGEVEDPADAARAQRLLARTAPLRTEPTALGAEIIDADVAQDGRVFAIGTVDGAGHAGWAARQVVLLAQDDGAWSVVGPPHDDEGNVINPRLRVVAALSGGRGYAVGDNGAVVTWRGDTDPVVVPRVTSGDLLAVDARRVGGRSLAYAAGADGRVVRLVGERAVPERAGSDTLRAIVIRSDGAVVAAASAGSGAPVLQRRASGGWSADNTELSLPAGASVHVSALADDPAGLWAAGGITYSAATGQGIVAPFVAQLAGGHWTTWCAGSPALTAVRELGDQTPRACDSTLAIDPATLGSAGDIVFTTAGVVVATPAGISIHTSRGFRTVPDLTAGAGADATDYRRLALGSDGAGWAVGRDGVARVLLSASAPQTHLQPVPAAGDTQELTVSVSGSQVLATAGGAVVDPLDHSAPPVDSGVQLRRAAWADDTTAWGIEQTTGALLRFADGRWSAPVTNADMPHDFSQVVDAMGAGNLPQVNAGDVGVGLRGLAFRDGTGFAVGDGGVIKGYAGDRWHDVESPTGHDLADVAIHGSDALAGGADGTIIEADHGDWQSADQAAELAGGRDVTAVGFAADGTRLVAAGGSVLTDDGKNWHEAGFAPLGVDIVKLRGYRVDGVLHALALVQTGMTRSLLDGDASGWRSVGEQLGVAISDFDLGSGDLWVAGRSASGPTVARLVPDAGTWTVRTGAGR